jgi:protein TonB
MRTRRFDGVHNDKWLAALATSLFLHALVLTAFSAFIPGEPAPLNKMKSPFYMEVTLQSITEPFLQENKGAALADSATSPSTAKFDKPGGAIANSDRSEMTSAVDADYKQVAIVQGSVGLGGGTGTGLSSGVGPGSGSATGNKGGSGITRGPEVLSGAKPDYPDAARANGWKGTVRLKILVSLSGEVNEVQVDTSSGFTDLDKAASRAVHNWRFQPALQNGAKVAAWVTLPIVFDLR